MGRLDVISFITWLIEGAGTPLTQVSSYAAESVHENFAPDDSSTQGLFISVDILQYRPPRLSTAVPNKVLTIVVSLTTRLWYANRFILGAVAFAAIALPRKWSDAKAFYSYAMRRDPLPAYRAGGIKDDHIVMAGRILFSYVLFLAYQVFQFPFSLEQRERHLFYIDLVFQSALLIFLYGAYSDFRKSVNKRWAAEEEKQKAVNDWLTKRLVGMNVKPGQLRSLAVSVFGGSFAPAFIAALPQMLDGAADLNRLAIESLRSAS